jgi:hypothetical protein
MRQTSTDAAAIDQALSAIELRKLSEQIAYHHHIDTFGVDWPTLDVIPHLVGSCCLHFAQEEDMDSGCLSTKTEALFRPSSAFSQSLQLF